MLRVQTAVGSDIRETDTAFRKVEAYVTARSEVTRCFAVVGGFGGGVSGGVVFVSVVDKSDRKLSQTEFAAEIRKELNSYPAVRVVVQDLSQSGFTAQRGVPVEFSVRGPDWDVLVGKARGISEKLSASGQVVDLDMDYRIGMPELRIVPNRARAADLGIPVEHVATALNATLGGLRIGKYSTEGRRIGVADMALASQFSSFLHPVTVLSIPPLSVAGAAFALLATGRSLNIFSMIGLLLMGIVKKNSIILVDDTNQLRERGLDTLNALLKAGPVRLRPILMTSIATMMAAISPAAGIGSGSEIGAPMGVAVIGGLIAATVLSLLVVPSFYLVTDRIAARIKGRRDEAATSAEPSAPSPSAP